MGHDDKDREIPEDLYQLAAKAGARHGKDWRALLRELLSELLEHQGNAGQDSWMHAQEKAFQKVWDNDKDSIYDDDL